MGCEPTAPAWLNPPEGLWIAGHCAYEGGTLLLIAPDEPGFWRSFSTSVEFHDGARNPLDRWSRRVIGGWAARIGARTLFPSDGPPFAPFIDWALASGQCWSSPTGMLVHDRMGLWISFRGALIVGQALPQPPAAPSPCEDCPRPCLSACPVAAFAEGYDVAACRGWLDGDAGRDCMNDGCRVRRACPISKGCGRLPQQSAWHMRQFHP